MRATANSLTEAIDKTLRETYDRYIIDKEDFTRLENSCRLDISDLNERFKNCKSVDDIICERISSPRISICGTKGFKLTLETIPIKGNLVAVDEVLRKNNL